MESNDFEFNEIKLVDINTGLGSEQLEQIIYSPRSEEPQDKTLDFHFCNNINRARYKVLFG